MRKQFHDQQGQYGLYFNSREITLINVVVYRDDSITEGMFTTSNKVNQNSSGTLVISNSTIFCSHHVFMDILYAETIHQVEQNKAVEHQTDGAILISACTRTPGKTPAYTFPPHANSSVKSSADNTKDAFRSTPIRGPIQMGKILPQPDQSLALDTLKIICGSLSSAPNILHGDNVYTICDSTVLCHPEVASQIATQTKTALGTVTSSLSQAIVRDIQTLMVSSNTQVTGMKV